MLKFQVYDQGSPAKSWRLRNAYLVGADQTALRGAEITFAEGEIICKKRDPGVSALICQHPMGDCGELTVQTCLLPDRDEPYGLSVEMARHRLMLTYNRLEEWGMLGEVEDRPLSQRLERAKELFIEALCLQPQAPVKADAVACESLAIAIDASEELALAHADLLLNRRKSFGSLPRQSIGCGVALGQSHERLRGALAGGVDFMVLPMPWRQLVPAEEEHRWDLTDEWVQWAVKNRLSIVAGPLVCFESGALPDWLFMWEHDYETMRDLVYEQIALCVNRYKGSISLWNVVSGLHVNSQLALGFDQIMELTRQCALIVKKAQPQARGLVEICQPFGEYYAANARSIPPLMYADLLVQNGVVFDGFALRLVMGQALPGQHVRDLMLISHLLDQYGSLGKPLHLIVAAPSEPVTEMMIAVPNPNQLVDPNCGSWRKPWSQLVQGRWLEAVFYLALSKPYVESVAWRHLVDHPTMDLPLSGLIDEELRPKAALRQLVSFRQTLLAKAPESPAEAGPSSPGQAQGADAHRA